MQLGSKYLSLAAAGALAAIPCGPLPAAAQGTFTPTGPLLQARDLHTATALPDGTVLIAGGETQACCTSTGSYGSRPFNSAEVYEPATRAFSPTSNSMSTVRYNHAATRCDHAHLYRDGYRGECVESGCHRHGV
jgi:hypothetical protein